MLDTLGRDLRFAARQLRRSPGFTVAVVLTLALGIGANAMMLSLVDTLLFRAPAGVVDAERVVRFYLTTNDPPFGRSTSGTMSVPDYEAFSGATEAFRSVAASSRQLVTIGRGRDAERADAGYVSHEFFPLLGVHAVLGRVFGPAEDRVGGAPVAVLSYGYWQRRFGGDRQVIGRALRIGSAVFTVIGVTQHGFIGPDLDATDLWLPIHVAGPMVFSRRALLRGSIWTQVLGRLAPGVTRPGAEAAATLAYRRAVRAATDQNGDTLATVQLGAIQRARGPEASRESRVAVWVAGVAAIVLLIACANVANLLLARVVARRHELALRLALGAGRGTMLRLTLVESVLLALLGAAASVLAVMWLAPPVRAIVLPIEAVGAPVDLALLVSTPLLALAAGLLAGVVPAVHAARMGVDDALRGGGRDSGGRRAPARAALIAGQVALTTVLLVGAGLFVRSLSTVQQLDFGVDLDRTLAVDVDVEHAGLDSARLPALRERLLARALAVPGVARGAIAYGGPVGWSFASDAVRLPGRDSIPALPSGGPYGSSVGPGIFDVFGAAMLDGRAFNDGDDASSAPVVIVNETMGRLLWPGQRAVGKCMYIGSDTAACREVVGVVQPIHRNGLIEDPQLMFYLPLAQTDHPAGHHSLYLRSASGVPPDRLVEPLRRALAGVDPELPFVLVRPLARAVAPQLSSWRMGATMFSAFGALALIVAAVGLYSVLAYSVARRTREIGVRMALGAPAADVARLVVRQAMLPVLGGAAAGGVLALLGARAAAALLYGVRPADPVSFAVAAASLLLVALAAAYLPARRAARISPSIALRSE